MKTKQIPAIIMLLAGFVTCIVAIFQGIEPERFLKILLAVLIGFYVAGCIIKVILDKNFKEMEETENEEETSEAKTEGEAAKEEEPAEEDSEEQTNE